MQHIQHKEQCDGSLFGCTSQFSTKRAPTQEETQTSCDINGKEKLITFTGFCWRCHSTEHNTYKCPNAKDDKYDGNYEKNRMRYLELKEIEMKKEKKCSRCTTKKKLSGFFLCDWYKDESERRVCKDCRKLEVKVCNMCNTWKKRHSFKKEQWDLFPRICKVCYPQERSLYVGIVPMRLRTQDDTAS